MIHLALQIISLKNHLMTEMNGQKLVKLVYIAHGWYLGAYGEPLISEAIIGLRYGPMISSVYDKFIWYGISRITSMCSVSGVYPMIYDKEMIYFLDKIWEVYKEYTGLQMSTITHCKGTPWEILWNSKKRKKKDQILVLNSTIQEYFKEKYNKINLVN